MHNLVVYIFINCFWAWCSHLMMHKDQTHIKRNCFLYWYYFWQFTKWVLHSQVTLICLSTVYRLLTIKAIPGREVVGLVLIIIT
jgi:hypothetical protein